MTSETETDYNTHVLRDSTANGECLVYRVISLACAQERGSQYRLHQERADFTLHS